jgi:hypothetical protein
VLFHRESGDPPMPDHITAPDGSPYTRAFVSPSSELSGQTLVVYQLIPPSSHP